MFSTKAKLGILISGRGSNMEAIIKATQTNQLDADVSVVISSRPNAKGLEIAKNAGITTFPLNISSFQSKIGRAHV